MSDPFTKGMLGLILCFSLGTRPKKARKSTAFFVITKTFLIFVHHKANPKLKVKDNGQMVAIAIGVIPIALEGSNGTFTEVFVIVFKQKILCKDACFSTPI